jgi:hypothetical protein
MKHINKKIRTAIYLELAIKQILKINPDNNIYKNEIYICNSFVKFTNEQLRSAQMEILKLYEPINVSLLHPNSKTKYEIMNSFYNPDIVHPEFLRNITAEEFILLLKFIKLGKSLRSRYEQETWQKWNLITQKDKTNETNQ